MKTRFTACAALLLSFVTSLSAIADTAIPSGKAVYDVTLTFTDYPELYEYGEWPIEIDFADLSQTFYGERVGVSTNIVDNVTNITLIARGVLDVKKMLDYAKTSAYVGGQSHIYTRNRTTNYYGTNDGGIWTSANGKFKFNDADTIEGFESAITNGFLDTVGHRTMSKPKSRAETGTPVMLNSMTIKLVRILDNTVCTAGTAVLCKLRVRFNRPLSAAGYESVTSFRLKNESTAGIVFDFNLSRAVMSDDGYEIYGLVKADIGSILTLINSDEYKTNENYKGQSRLYLNGSSTSIAGGSQYWLSATDGMTVADLSTSIEPSLIYRDYQQIPCRIASIDLEPKTSEGGLFLMRW